MNLPSLLRFVALAALWGGSFLFMRIAAPVWGAVPTAFGRVVLGAAGLLALLALVRLGPGAYGATVRREIEEHAGREVSISAVYTTLERLEQKGFVRSRIGEPTAERGGRRRRHFEMLPLGARSLRDAYRAISGMTAGIERRLKTLS